MKKLPRVANPVSSSSTKSTSSASAKSCVVKSQAPPKPRTKATSPLCVAAESCPYCPLNPQSKKAFSKSYYSRDQFENRDGHATVCFA